MNQPQTPATGFKGQRGSDHPEATASGVSWSAVLAGSFVMAALYLILLALGAGLGLSSTSILSTGGISSTRIGTATILWLIFAEIVSSAMGGYLAGRLRTKWTVIHSDEVYFRDTAHGFLSWSLALVVTAAFLGSAATLMIGSPGPTQAASSNAVPSPNAYFVDAMLRPDAAHQVTDSAPVHQEVATIVATSLKNGGLSEDDKAYLDQLVSARTGLDQVSADKHVADVYAKVQAAAETARKDLAHTLLWTFIALLIGAFFASFAGTIGGRQRDNVVII